jgi:hypothetical protein
MPRRGRCRASRTRCVRRASRWRSARAWSSRLEILNDALGSLFAEIPPEIDLFDRGVVPGDPPRLWVDMIAHVAMGRDKRVYRFVQDTRYGRRVLAESADVADIVKAVTQYVARRLVERERAIATAPAHLAPEGRRPPRRWLGWILAFLFGLLAGVGALFATAWYLGGGL